MRAPSELTKPRIPRQSGAVALLLLALALSAHMITIDLRNTLRYGGTDMRGHVVGARLLARDADALVAGGQRRHLADLAN